MAWTLGSVRVYVQDAPRVSKQIVAKLQPLDNGTVHQVFGYENLQVKLQAVVIGETHLYALEGYAKDGTVHNLSTPFGDYGTFYVLSVEGKPRNVVSQSVDLTQPCTATVYDVSIELSKE